MALVENVEEGGKLAKEHKIPVVCRCRIGRETGRVQLETYREGDKLGIEPATQIIQFTETSAGQLIAIFKDVFPNL
jgi:hypothetical protein